MRVIHITRRRMALMSLALGLVIGSALLLAGCFGGDKETEVITAATNEERVAYLEGSGLAGGAAAHRNAGSAAAGKAGGRMGRLRQAASGAGPALCRLCGQAVKRYTYTVTNYPEIPQGVQANLYLWGDQIIGGDVIFTGQGGFQTDLAFPKA